MVIAGPAGAARDALATSAGVEERVDADAPADRPAARALLERLRDLGNRRASFALLTSLRPRSFAAWLTDLQLQDDAPEVELWFCWAPHADGRGLANFFELYAPITRWRLFDGARLVARGVGEDARVVDEARWARLRPGP